MGLPAKEWALVGLNGNDVYSETRGLLAGYNWPQYAVHRGQFHMLLHDEAGGADRAGGGQARKPCDRLPKKSRWQRKRADRTRGGLDLRGERRAADRCRRHPLRGPGADASRSAADPLGRGDHVARHHLGQADPHRRLFRRPWHASPADGVLSDLASRPAAPASRSSTGSPRSRWTTRRAGSRAAGSGRCAIDDFVHHFENWIWDWLDVPALIRQADSVFENPMIDRDPVPTWRDGPVLLLGDAAHAMYPTGSNGGSQAIVDARVLGAAMVEHGVTQEALAAYDESCAARSRSSSAQSRRGRSGCSTWSTNVAAAHSTTSTTSSRRRSAPSSWPATRLPRALRDRKPEQGAADDPEWRARRAHEPS